MSKTSQQKGRDYEVDLAKRMGAKATPGSGNKWFSKLDIKGQKFLFSLKYTDKVSFSITKAIMYEAVSAIIGPGGKGEGTYPGLAIRLENDDYIVLRAADFFEIVEEEVKMIAPSKKREKIELSKVPKGKREDHGD